MITTQSATQRLFSSPNTLDDNLPFWARRSNPIIRRQLGVYWRVLIPEMDNIMRWLVVQSLMLLVTIQFPALLTPILMLVLASFMLMPFAFVMYARVIANVVVDSVTSITREFRDETLLLLRMTPIPLEQILLSKVAATLWRRMETVDNILALAVALGTPLILLSQILYIPPDEHFGLTQAVTIIIMFTSILRLPLEIFMVGMLGTAIGTAARFRPPAIIATGTVVFFYFLLLNLPRFISLSMPMRLFVEVVLPVALPLVIIYGCLRFTIYIIQRD